MRSAPPATEIDWTHDEGFPVFLPLERPLDASERSCVMKERAHAEQLRPGDLLQVMWEDGNALPSTGGGIIVTSKRGKRVYFKRVSEQRHYGTLLFLIGSTDPEKIGPSRWVTL